MDVLNFISWIRGRKQVTTVDATKTLIPVGLKDNKRDDGYIAGAITVQDFVNQFGGSSQGPAGPQGIQGPIGAQGIPGPVGPAGLNWQGVWSASGTYVVDDAVGYDGASWFCIDPVGPSATTPDLDPTNWALLAAEGAQGPQGIPGAQGPTGAQGPSGGYTYGLGDYVPSEGGVIFHCYINAGIQYYLVTPIVDQSTGHVWSNIDNVLIGPSAQSSWDGLTNSNAIVNQPGETTSAAALCLNLVTGGKSDWYLPSIDELSLLKLNRFNVNKTLSTIVGATIFPNDQFIIYWSSNELTPNVAWNYYFGNGNAQAGNKTETQRVRAVRRFSI